MTDTKDKKLFLLDALALIYRAHFAFIKTPRINSKGINTSSILGFNNALLDVINRYQPTHLGVAFDTPEPTFRHIEFKEYKAHREAMPEAISHAIPIIKKLLYALNIPVLEKGGYEADDIIGTLAKKAENAGYQVYMVTPDKDYAQLVTENVFLVKPAKKGNGPEIMTPDDVLEKMGIPPENVIDFLGLKGDAVDNIPGVPKVGDKTAISLISEFGTIENILANTDKITKKAVKESLITNSEQGLLSKRLATIMIDAPVEWDEDLLKIGEANVEETVEILKELEFKTAGARLLASPIFKGKVPVQKDLFGNSINVAFTPEKPVVQPSTYSTIEDRKHSYSQLLSDSDKEKLAKRIKKSGVLCFDTETTGLNAMEAELIAVTFSVEETEAFFLHIDKKDLDKVPEVLGPLFPLFQDPSLLKIGQNIKYDLLMMKSHGVEVTAPYYDTMLADCVINPDKSHSMDNISKELLSYEPVSITSLIGKKGKGQLSMRQVPMEKLTEYACEDADITLSIKNRLDKIVEEKQLRNVLEKMEFPLIPVLTKMEYRGVCINKEFLNKYGEELGEIQKKVEAEIYDLAGVKFNINSPKQLGEVIFDKLQLAKGKKTKSGQYSTKEEILTKLAENHEMPSKVLRFRQLGKLKSTYVDALPELLNSKTGRIHTTYSQSVASTGRLSSNNPNLQNIPIRTPEGKKVRKAFIAPEGFELLAADYSQVELRLIAHFAEDEIMIQDFKDGRDIHKATAARVFGVDFEEVTKEMRSKAKMVNFGIIYGISAYGLGQRLGIRRSEAAEIIESYFTRYPAIKRYMDTSVTLVQDKGYAETIMGRVRYLPDIHSGNATVRGFAERNAINTPVQGSAADLIKMAMIDVHHAMIEKQVKSHMIMQVHDELVFEVAEGEMDLMKELVVDKMENAIPFKVPMKVEFGTGHNWLEAH